MLNFVRIVVFDVEAPPENAKLPILEGIEWQIRPLPTIAVGGIWKFAAGKFSGILVKQNVIYDLSIY